MPQRLINDDGTTRVWKHTDVSGNVVGSSVERYVLDTATQNAETLRTRLRQALATNATYLALGTPTNAQNLAQIRALTRECSALIRSALAELDDITGT